MIKYLGKVKLEKSGTTQYAWIAVWLSVFAQIVLSEQQPFWLHSLWLQRQLVTLPKFEIVTPEYFPLQ